MSLLERLTYLVRRFLEIHDGVTVCVCMLSSTCLTFAAVVNSLAVARPPFNIVTRRSKALEPLTRSRL